ncbi:hypothetical protein TNCV_1635451 [Trichonephila clavipes]|nr:hypothetical protein TNCV_1635451 [Trichonephila clavipes]
MEGLSKEQKQRKRNLSRTKTGENMLGGVLEHDTRIVDFRPCPPPLKTPCVRYWAGMSEGMGQPAPGPQPQWEPRSVLTHPS